MGNEIECCRRPQTQPRKDIKTYRGIQPKNLPNYKSSDIEEDDNFGTFKKNNFDQNSNEDKDKDSSFLGSIYGNKNDFPENFPKFSNFDMEPVSDPLYSNQDYNPPIQVNQAPENINIPQYENNQYINSFSTDPQENGLPQIQSKEEMPIIQNIQPQKDFQQEEDNYNQEIPTKYNSYEPANYMNSPPVNYNTPESVPIINSTSDEYINTQPVNYINNQNGKPNPYSNPKPISNIQNIQKIQKTQNIQKPQNIQKSQNAQNIPSQQYHYTQKPLNQTTQYTSSNPIQYSEQSYTNFEAVNNYYESQNYKKYIEQTDFPEYIEDTNNNNYYEVQNNPIYYEEKKPTKYIESKPQTNFEYLPPKKEYKKENKNLYIQSHTNSTEYISSNPEKEEIQYIEPQRQIEYTIEKQFNGSQPNKKLYIESQNQINDGSQKVQKANIKKKYISKPIQSTEKESVKENDKKSKKEPKVEEKSSSPPKEDEFPEIQKGPDELDLSEAEPKPYKNIDNKTKGKRQQLKKHSQHNNKKNNKKKKLKKYSDSEEEQKEEEEEENSDNEEKEDISEIIKINNEKNYGKKNKNSNNNDESEFSCDRYKILYPENDPFFKKPKGKKSYKIYDIDDNKSNRAIYEGEMLNGKKHGVGKLKTKENFREGTWKEDKFTGWGREKRQNGEILEGRFINGKVEGKGILRDSRDSSYIGDFVDSKRDGYGELDTEKAYYRGEFKNNKFHGHGKIKIKEDESEIDGMFMNGEIEKENANVFCRGKPSKSSIVEKNKETTACQAPAFLSNFFTKIFS